MNIIRTNPIKWGFIYWYVMVDKHLFFKSTDSHFSALHLVSISPSSVISLILSIDSTFIFFTSLIGPVAFSSLFVQLPHQISTDTTYLFILIFTLYVEIIVTRILFLIFAQPGKPEKPGKWKWHLQYLEKLKKLVNKYFIAWKKD